MSDRDADALAMAVLGICLILIVLTAAAIWYVIAGIVASWRFHRYLERSKENYAKVAAKVGADGTVQDMYEMLGAMGLEIDQASHYASEADCYSAVFFGVEQVEDKGA